MADDIDKMVEESNKTTKQIKELKKKRIADIKAIGSKIIKNRKK